METKANYAAVGMFVMACVLGTVVALLWLAGAQYSEEYAYYNTYFSGSVSGLGKGTSVRYNGIEVGRVDNIDFDPQNPDRVVVRLEVKKDLKIHADSFTTIASMGLTGGSYVEINGGTKKADILPENSVIQSKQSALQELEQSAPRMIAKISEAATSLNEMLNAENRKNVTGILANLDKTTGVLASRSNELDVTIANLSLASKALNQNLVALHTVLGHTDDVAVGASKVLKGDTFNDIQQLTTEARGLVVSLHRLSNEIDREPTRLLFGDRREGYTPR